jgi:hypothetical protein
MLTKKDKQSKRNAEGDDSLDMNVFEKFMEDKHTMIVTKSNDDLVSINDTDTFDYSMQDKVLTNFVNIIIISMIMMNSLTHLVKELN